jgi:hypothetical protein
VVERLLRAADTLAKEPSDGCLNRVSMGPAAPARPFEASPPAMALKLGQTVRLIARIAAGDGLNSSYNCAQGVAVGFPLGIAEAVAAEAAAAASSEKVGAAAAAAAWAVATRPEAAAEEGEG